MSRDPSAFLEDIEESCTKIINFAGDLSRREVFADPMRLDAILHNFQVIGEAVKRLPDAIRQRYPEIPWKQIAGMRDFIAHAYFSVDLDVLWRGISEDVPALRRTVRDILSARESWQADPELP